MTNRLSRLAVAAVAIAICGVGCSSHAPNFPASPVPAALNDLEAARMGDAFLNQQNDRHHMLYSALRQGDGYLLAYTTTFDPDGKPPKEWHLVIVRDDGAVREVRFAQGQ